MSELLFFLKTCSSLVCFSFVFPTGTINVGFSRLFDKSHIGVSPCLCAPVTFPLPSRPHCPYRSSPRPSWSLFFLATNASQCSSKSTASPCPWVWRSTASPSSTWSRWGYIESQYLSMAMWPIVKLNDWSRGTSCLHTNRDSLCAEPT